MSEATQINQRVMFMRGMLDNNRETPQGHIISEFKRRFGHGVSFISIKKCREAHAKGKFSEVAVPIFTAVVKKANATPKKKAKKKAAKKKTTKKAAKKSTTKKAASKATKKKAKKKASKKVRGERRTKVERSGRRKADKLFVDASKSSKHLVLVVEEGRVVDHRFKSKKDAESCINNLISAGTSPNKITYYTRQEVNYKISL